MALPYSPRTTFDVTVNLGSTSTRSFEGSTYAGKHVRVIPKTILDTAKGLLFSGAASVTLIGGQFKPSARTTWAAGNTADGHFVFFNCGAVYVEGVHLDGINVTELDGIQVSAITSNTQVTIQNCRFDNIKGIQSGLHGDIFQTGSTNMGPTGAVRVHRLSGNCNYQGFFLDPQNSGTRGGGIASLTMSDVNVVRNGTTTSRLYFFYNDQSRYTSFGYPISLTNVWANPGSGQTVQEDAVWPASYAGSNGNFPDANYQAKRASDSTGPYAHWPGLNASGKVLSGRVYEGTPPGGDFVKASDVGLGYVQGTDLGTVTPPVDPGPTPNPTYPVPTAEPAGSNMIKQANWITGGTGTTAISSISGNLTVTPANDTTRTYFRQQLLTEIGKTYWITWDLVTSNQMWRMLGTTENGTDIVNINVSVVSENKIVFTATTTSVWLEFNRVSAGGATVGSVRCEEVTPGRVSARRLNGRTQVFKIDAGAASLRTSNSLQYFGGWFKFQTMPTSAAYILDCGVPDATASGGQQRARLLYDPAVPKIMASNAGVSKYAENYVSSAGLAADQWHYVGMRLAADGGVTVIYDGTIGGTTTGTGVPEVANYLGTIQFGARTGTTPTSYAPVILSDWIWCNGFVPTNTQILALAAGNRPPSVSGLSPTYYWTLDGTAVTEASSTGTATLTAPTSPASVVGPEFISAPVDEILPCLFF